MSTRLRDFLSGIAIVALVAALVIFLVDSLSSYAEWAWPAWVIVLTITACIVGMWPLIKKGWVGLIVLPIVLLMVADAINWDIGNWFLIPEQGKSQTTAAADCLNTEQKAFVISTSDPLITPAIKAKAATMKDDDSLCATARAILTRVMAAPAQDVPTATAEADKPIPTSASRCRPINDYPTQFLPELSSSGQWILVEMRLDDGTEYEAVLNTTDAPGGRFIITQPFAGHAWEYGPGCSRSDVDAAAVKRTASEIAGGVNNLGTAPDDVVSRMLHPVGS